MWWTQWFSLWWSDSDGRRRLSKGCMEDSRPRARPTQRHSLPPQWWKASQGGRLIYSYRVSLSQCPRGTLVSRRFRPAIPVRASAAFKRQLGRDQENPAEHLHLRGGLSGYFTRSRVCKLIRKYAYTYPGTQIIALCCQRFLWNARLNVLLNRLELAASTAGLRRPMGCTEFRAGRRIQALATAGRAKAAVSHSVPSPVMPAARPRPYQRKAGRHFTAPGLSHSPTPPRTIGPVTWSSTDPPGDGRASRN